MQWLGASAPKMCTQNSPRRSARMATLAISQIFGEVGIGEGAVAHKIVRNLLSNPKNLFG